MRHMSIEWPRNCRRTYCTAAQPDWYWYGTVILTAQPHSQTGPSMVQWYLLHSQTGTGSVILTAQPNWYWFSVTYCTAAQPDWYRHGTVILTRQPDWSWSSDTYCTAKLVLVQWYLLHSQTGPRQLLLPPNKWELDSAGLKWMLNTSFQLQHWTHCPRETTDACNNTN